LWRDFTYEEINMNTSTKQLHASLLILRLGITVVMLAWTIDKLMRPEHAIQVLQHFYGLGALGAAPVYILAAAELILVVLFVLGLFKTWTYGLVLLFNAATTLVSFNQYLHPFEGANLLFYAAWPMLGACLALFLLRKDDRFSLGKHS
jgi:uncharacterized membrane protein YphA (DoxX/SURF4 family)